MKQFCSELGLPLPKELPNELQGMLKKCFEETAEKRPSFDQIWKQFSFLNVIWQLNRFFFRKDILQFSTLKFQKRWVASSFVKSFIDVACYCQQF